ncbi:MAG: fibronectin type III domain-containing protein [Saprospiraceae bacterium]
MLSDYWKHIFIILSLFIFSQENLSALTGRYRVMWVDDPSTTMTIGWEQISGNGSIVYFDQYNGGQEIANYGFYQKVDRKKWSKGMNNHFARLTNLQPNTIYHFIIKDSEGVSQKMSFKTAPDNPYERLSIIAGGDSRNHRKARCKANLLVSKLRPHAVMFGGDMTGGDIERQWKAWFDDWQKTMTVDGHLTPIIPARGNHESSNESLVDMFDVRNKKNMYALNLGGSLLRIYTLNSMIAAGGDQRNWLENDLSQSTHIKWKMAQYHHAIRPHMNKKSERNAQMKNWGTLFYKYGVDLVCESDAHVVKTTYPIRPSKERGSDEGFIRDDKRGTVYVGEGCWGAPLRRNNDDKSWTRASGSFNQFKWIFIDLEGIEVRTIKVDNAEQVASVDANDIFSEPVGLDVWKPRTGSVLRIGNKPVFVNNENPPSSISNSIPKRKKLEPKRLVNIKPLEVSQFQSKIGSDEVVVQWMTKNENLQPIFEIQRSIDGKGYLTLARVQGTGDAKKVNAYKIVDNLKGIASGTYPKYRLKCTQSSGEVLLLQAEREILENKEWNNHDRLQTNPRTGQIQFKYNLQKPADISVRLVNAINRQVLKNDFTNTKSGNFLQSLDVSNIEKGNYLLIIEANKKVIQKYKVEKKS